MVVREPTTGLYLPFGNLKTTAISEYSRVPSIYSLKRAVLDQFKREGGATVTCASANLDKESS